MATREDQTRKGDLLPGSSLGHTTPPAMPGNFLSRKELFHLIDTRSPGATIVLAPSGYGKTTKKITALKPVCPKGFKLKK